MTGCWCEILTCAVSQVQAGEP